MPSPTIVSCDNIEGNGEVARAAFTEFAERTHPGLAEWMTEHTRFPNSMVDRITPATTPEVIEALADEFGVEDQWQLEMLTNLMIAVPTGILLVFAVLVLLYHRIISPLVNMGSLFLAPLGGFLALFLTGQSLSMPVFIGVLMLLGIVAKNSILLIDFALEEMQKGVETVTAIIDAGHKRAQPIVRPSIAVPTVAAISSNSS